MARGIDTGTSQRNLNFPLARSQGQESCYVKLGGDNVGRYVAPNYVNQVDSARNAGMRVGHYWVVDGGSDVNSAADYFVDHLRGWTLSDFIVLDNEPLDGASMMSDAQASAWIRRVASRLGIGTNRIFQYLGLSQARSNQWPQSLATGCNFIIAAYGYTPFAFFSPTIPMARILGHQYSSSGNIGGVTIDLNDWKPNAFAFSGTAGENYQEIDMPLTQDDLLAILTANFKTGTKNADGTDRTVNVSQALGAVILYGDVIDAKITELDKKLAKPVAVTLTDADRAAISALVAKSLDVNAIAAAVVDMQAKRLLS